MKDPYKILGLPESASYDELKAKYQELKAKLSEDRFLPGEAGNDAARALGDLETAWKEIEAQNQKKEQKKTFGGDWSAIDNLIKEGRYNEAQAMLDAAPNRIAEWHYLQSIIYYKREWMSECKSQLSMAVQMEPWNEKYKIALEKLNLIMGNPQTNPHNLGRDPNTQYQQPNNQQMCGNSCVNCCLAYCIADCCCTMMQCC